MYGGAWAENVTQAVARDLLVDAMKRLRAAGYRPVAHTHDETVAEMPIGQGSLKKFSGRTSVSHVPPVVPTRSLQLQQVQRAPHAVENLFTTAHGPIWTYAEIMPPAKFVR
jgi:hypothetical protein